MKHYPNEPNTDPVDVGCGVIIILIICMIVGGILKSIEG